MYSFNKKENKIIKNIRECEYMSKTIQLIDTFLLEQKTTKTYHLVFDELYNILNAAKPFVDSYLSEREKNNEIKDKKQAIKAIAGNSFSQAIVYSFLLLKEIGTISSNIFITSHKASVPSFKKISTIYVDGETQKPDTDLVIYSILDSGELKKCMILSLKTSLRERASQTYKWKLLMEIATSDSTLKDKYNIAYNADEMPLVCFATVNFYNEINKPQHRGMYKFFDNSFIAKKVDAQFVSRLSELPNYVNSVL